MSIINKLRWFTLRLTTRNLGIAILILLIQTGTLAGQSNRDPQQYVVGTYAATFDGTLLVTLEDGTKKPVPEAGLGLLTIDREGNISIHGYIAAGDTIRQFGIEPNDPSFTGTITVNPDCTGIMELSMGEVFEVIVLDGGNELNYTQTFSRSGAPTVTGTARRISRMTEVYRSNGDQPYHLLGTYTGNSSGIDINPDLGPLPCALLGRTSIDYDGTLEYSGTKVVAGNPIPITLVDAELEEGELAYTVMLTATVMVRGTENELGTWEGWFIILDGGNELWGIALDEPAGKPVVLGNMKRISMQPSELEME